MTGFRRSGRTFRVKLRNANEVTVVGRLSVRLNGTTVRYRTPARRSRTFSVKVGRKSLRRVRRAGAKARYTLRLTGQASVGRSRTSAVQVKR